MVKIKVKDMNSIIFLPSTFNNGAKIKFHKNITLLEELEPSEIIQYNLEIESTKEQKILFTI
jgi:hypothetical protein